MSQWNEAMWFSIPTGAAAKSVAVLAAAWMAAFMLRKHSAATRHLVWTAAFAAVLVLPFLSAALPALRVPLAGTALSATGADFQITADATAIAGATRADAPNAMAERRPAAGWRPDFVSWLLLLWAAGATAAGTRTLAAYAVAGRARRSARPFPDGGLATMLARTLGIRRRVDVLEIKPGCMPMAFGVLRPAILMPADACAWSEEKRRMVLLHELAHVRRGDAATHLLARAAMALYWWNPLAWTAWREFLKEGERAADDLVLNTGARASEYAGNLLEIARTMQGSRVMAWAAPAMARRSQLEGRLLAILDSGVNRAAPSRASVLAAATLAVAMVAPLAALRAQAPSREATPAGVDAAIRAAQSQKNYETLDAAARAATRLGKYESAHKLLESALAIRAEVSGVQSVEYGIGLVKLAELEQKRDPKSGGDLYAKAAQILGEKPEAAPVLTHLGLAALDKHDFAQAFDYFQHAQQVAPVQAGTSLMWMAVVRQTEKNMGAAELLYRNALAAAEPKSGDAAVIMEVFAQFLREQGRMDEAGDFSARAAAIQSASNGTPPALPDGVFRVGPGVSAPVPLKKQEPKYSVEARAARLQGTVVIQVAIGTDGLAHDARVLRGVGLGLDENAIDAVSQWQFKPAMKDGQPVKVKATIEVNYRLL